MAHYANHSIVIQDAADGSATTVGSLTQVSAPIDNEVLKDETAGNAYVDQISVVSQKPRCTFSTFDLPKIIGKLGFPGFAAVEDTGIPGFALYQAQYSNGAVVSGSNHRRLRYAKSHTRINRISVSHRQDAQVECECVPTYDGTNDPIIVESSQALPTLPSTPGRWTLNSLTVGGTTISCNIQIDIDFGFSVDAFGCDDDIWDTHFHVNKILPTISITSLAPQNFVASGGAVLEGLVGTQANSTITLKKRTPHAATYVADGTAEHIEIAFAGVILPSDAHNASGNAKAQSNFMIEVAYDGTNAPFTFDTAFALA